MHQRRRRMNDGFVLFLQFPQLVSFQNISTHAVARIHAAAGALAPGVGNDRIQPIRFNRAGMEKTFPGRRFLSQPFFLRGVHADHLLNEMIGFSAFWISAYIFA